MAVAGLVDDAGRRPYIGVVNLLLLLSALLSALTGAGVAARAPQVAVTVSRAVEHATVEQVRPARMAGVSRFSLPTLFDVAAVLVTSALRLQSLVPLYLSRRRE